LDPSLTATGWSVIDKGKVLACGCIQTKADPKIKLKSEQDTKRIVDFLSALSAIKSQYKLQNMCSESPTGSKSSTAIKALSLIKGALLGWSHSNIIDIEWISARNSKIKATGIVNAEKDQVYDCMILKFPEIVSMLDKKNKVIKYAVTDSLSVYTASKYSKTISN